MHSALHFLKADNEFFSSQHARDVQIWPHATLAVFDGV